MRHHGYYNVDPTVVQHHGFAAPNRPGVRGDLLVVSLGGNGQYERVINDRGADVGGVHGAVDGGVVPVRDRSLPSGRKGGRGLSRRYRADAATGAGA